MSTFESLIEDLTRDVNRAQPKDALQFCSNWFQARLEEQRTRTRDTLSTRNRAFPRELPTDLFVDAPLGSGETQSSVSPFSQAISRSTRPARASLANIHLSPFGTLNVAGNALLSDRMDTSSRTGSPLFTIDDREIPPTSPLTTNPFASFENNSVSSASFGPGDFLQPQNAGIFARRTSVSAESIVVDSSNNEPLPRFPKSPDQLRRIKASIKNNFIFRDLDEEQESGVLGAMQEMKVGRGEVVIRQGDVGDYFYVVESGSLCCYIRSDHTPTSSPSETPPPMHPEYGRKVAECNQGDSFGELALMHGHPRAATVVSVEPSVLWALDRITFRTIILKAAHRRRTMYEQFLASVDLLSSLEPEERSKIADALVSRVYADGEAVVTQGEMGDTFFFVEEGEATVTKHAQGGQGEIKVGHLRKGDYFGELSLLRLEPRAATVSAVARGDSPLSPKLKVAALDAQAFTRLLGPLREIMERKAREIYGPGQGSRLLR